MPIKPSKQRVRENLILAADAQCCAYCQTALDTPQIEHNGNLYCGVRCYLWDNTRDDQTIVETRNEISNT